MWVRGEKARRKGRRDLKNSQDVERALALTIVLIGPIVI